jgi:hypothetical protein
MVRIISASSLLPLGLISDGIRCPGLPGTPGTSGVSSVQSSTGAAVDTTAGADTTAAVDTAAGVPAGAPQPVSAKARQSERPIITCERATR